MPELDFQITGVEAASHGLTPLIHFGMEVTNATEAEQIHSVVLQAQIQIAAPGRGYTAVEKARLVEVFGMPERWGQTLRNQLWAHANTVIGAFSSKTKTVIPVPCTFDLNVLGGKYFYALDGGEVPLVFLFSGSIFYAGENGNLQVQPISWEKECTYRMPIAVWKNLMDRHYPNTTWIALRRDVFERLNAYKREHGIPTWEGVIDRILPIPGCEEVAA